jgi:hypothetical protein
MSRFASKLQSWDKLFTITTTELRDEVGMATAKDRRYLFRWLEKFRQGKYGIGGDLDHVVDGVAELKVVLVPEEKMPGFERKKSLAERELMEKAQKERGTLISPPGMRYAIVNVPNSSSSSTESGQQPSTLDVESLTIKKLKHIKLHQGYMIRAPYIELTKAVNGGVHGMQARLAVQEGLWEDKLGRKIDGGERKQAEVKAKRRATERRAREQEAAQQAAA